MNAREHEFMAKGELPPELNTGEISFQMQSSLRFGLKAILFALLGIAGFGIISFTGAPFVLAVLIHSWFAGGLIFLGGISYGILNDLLAVRKNLPYFTLGHQPGQRGLIKSNDPNAVGIAWGILATYGLALPAGILFAAATLITGLIGMPFAGFVLPIIALIVPAVVGLGHLYAARQERKYNAMDFPQQIKDALENDNLNSGLDSYQTSRLKYWLRTPKDVAAWLSNGSRNGFGYMVLPAVALLSLIAYVVISALPTLLPALAFTAAFAAFPPLGAGLLLATGIIAACVYLYKNHEKKVENAYKLDYPEQNTIKVNYEDENDSSPSPALANHPESSHARINRTLPVDVENARKEKVLRALFAAATVAETRVPAEVAPSETAEEVIDSSMRVSSP